MTLTPLGALGTAVVLGVTHALEPDHVAGISSLAGKHTDARFAALVGACFSLGHVVLVVAWLGVGFVILDRPAFPAGYSTVGTFVVAIALGVLGAATVIRGLLTVRHTHVHAHTPANDSDFQAHVHPHFHVPGIGERHDHDSHGGSHDPNPNPNPDPNPNHKSNHNPATVTGHGGDNPTTVIAHDHDHGLGAKFRAGIVGSIFTLSPPVSMLVFISTLFSTSDGNVIALAVLAYAVGIVTTMSAVGGGVGTLFDLTSVSRGVAGGVRVVSGLAITALACWTFVGTI